MTKPETRKVNLGSAIVVAGITLVVGILIGINWNSIASNFLPYLGFKVNSANDWTALDEVYGELSRKYDGSVDKNAAIEGAKKGIAASVGDVYTSYMTAVIFIIFIYTDFLSRKNGFCHVSKRVILIFVGKSVMI